MAALALIMVTFGLISGIIAHHRTRDPIALYIYFVIGGLLMPIGLTLALVSEPAEGRV